MTTLFITTSDHLYVDDEFTMLGIEDVYRKLENTHAHYRAVGLDLSLVDALIR